MLFWGDGSTASVLGRTEPPENGWLWAEWAAAGVGADADADVPLGLAAALKVPDACSWERSDATERPAFDDPSYMGGSREN